MALTEYAARFLRFGAKNSDDNPFIRPKPGICILRSDAIKVVPWYDKFGQFKGYKQHYFWHGNLISIQETPLDSLRDEFTFSGIEVRCKVDLNSMGLKFKGT